MIPTALHHFLRLTGVAAVLAGLAAAQTPCHSEFGKTSTHKDTVSMGGPNFTNCIQTTVAKTTVVQAVEVFTGERTGTSVVGIWSADAKNGKPKDELAIGMFRMSTTKGWQGANLSKPVILIKGQTYYVSWMPVSGCQASVEASGGTLPGIQTYYWSRTNSAPWNGPYKGHQWKFRLWCSKLVQPGVSVIGSGCTNGDGSLGVWQAVGTPTVGNATFSVQGRNLPASQIALAVIGGNKNFVSVDLTKIGAPGCFIHTDEVIYINLKTSKGSGVAGRSDGTAVVSAPVPNNAALKGYYLRSQLWVWDPSSKRSYTAVFTNGVGITVQ